MDSVMTEVAETIESHPESPTTDEQDTILVVDDSPIDSRLAAGIIRKKLGLQVIFAGNGHEAMEAIRLQSPSAVLTDLLMPEMDGLELVHEIVRSHLLAEGVLSWPEFLRDSSGDDGN